MKKIRLTESQLHRVIKESVKRILREYKDSEEEINNGISDYYKNTLNDINKETLVPLIKDFIKTYKNYRFDSPLKYNVNKVFNHGMGSLSLFRFDVKSHTVFVNSALANSKDMDRLNLFLNENNMTDWNIQKKEYGYTDWYSHNF